LQPKNDVFTIYGGADTKLLYKRINLNFMSYELFIAKKYFRSKRRTGFISLINYISIIGVMIGVASLIIVLSVMNGFETEVRSRIIGFDAHIQFTGPFKGIDNYETILKKLKSYENVVGVSPYILNKGMISVQKNSDALVIKGVDPKTISEVSDIKKNIIYGEFNLDTVWVVEGSPLPGIVLGKNLAMRLDVNLNDQVWVYGLPRVRKSLISLYQQQQFSMPFRVAGLFETELYEFDNIHGFISNKNAQKLLRTGNLVSGIEIVLNQMDLNLITKVANKIQHDFGDPYKAETWYDRNKNLFASMEFEKKAAFIILCLIITVAAFNIISTLIMVVMEKKQEIGILKSMGSTSKSIMKIFIFQGIISGTIGTIVGSILGYMLCWSQLKYKWLSLPSDIFFVSALPVEMKIWDFVMITVIGILLCFISTLYPSWKAAKLDPVQAIRYE